MEDSSLLHLAESGVNHLGLTVELKEAHRMSGIHNDDWPALACRAGGSTYCVASAAYWWGRLGAASIRIMHYIWAHVLPGGIFLLADDWDLPAKFPNFPHSFLSLLTSTVNMDHFRMPFSWKKSNVPEGVGMPGVGMKLAGKNGV